MFILVHAHLPLSNWFDFCWRGVRKIRVRWGMLVGEVHVSRGGLG